MSVVINDGGKFRFRALNVEAALTEVRRVEQRTWAAIIYCLRLRKRRRVRLWTINDVPLGWRLADIP